MANSKDLKMIREDLIGEFNAIDQYQAHIDMTADKKIKEVLSHIIADEKEHVAELTKLLRQLDAVQEQKFAKEGL